MPLGLPPVISPPKTGPRIMSKLALFDRGCRDAKEFRLHAAKVTAALDRVTFERGVPDAIIFANEPSA